MIHDDVQVRPHRFHRPSSRIVTCKATSSASRSATFTSLSGAIRKASSWRSRTESGGGNGVCPAMLCESTAYLLCLLPSLELCPWIRSAETPRQAGLDMRSIKVTKLDKQRLRQNSLTSSLGSRQRQPALTSSSPSNLLSHFPIRLECTQRLSSRPGRTVAFLPLSFLRAGYSVCQSSTRYLRCSLGSCVGEWRMR